MNQKTNQVRTIDKIAYGIGDMGNGLSMQIVGSYLVFFMTVILHIPGTVAGTLIGISIIWDAVTDPVMGYISDNTRSSRFGRRHLYLLIGMVGVPLSILGLFFIPINSNMTLKVILLLLFILMYKTFITILVTPFTALGAELSNDYHERTRIQSIRSVFFILGVGLSTVAGMYIFFKPTVTYPIGQLNPDAYKNMAVVTCVLVVISMAVCYTQTRKYIPKLNEHLSTTHQDSRIKHMILSFMGTLNNKAFKFVAITYMFSNIASAFINNIGIHVFTYTFGFTNTLISAIIGIQFIFSILSQPLWILLVRVLDKKKSVLLALLLTVAGGFYFLALVIYNNQIGSQLIFFIPYAVLAGIGTGALFTIPASMVADTIDVEELESGERTEGVYFGSMTFIYKLSQAITVFLIGFLLDLISFNSNITLQSERTQIYLGLILSFGVIISFSLAAMSISKYPLTRHMIAEIQSKLKNKHLSNDK